MKLNYHYQYFFLKMIKFNKKVCLQQIKMGFKIQNYPFVIQTGLMIVQTSKEQFSISLQSALQNKCSFLISNIFMDSYIKEEQEFNLDYCYICSQQDFQRSEINLIIPLLNEPIWSLQPKRRLKFLELTLGYISYLGLSRFSVRLTDKNFTSVAKSLLDEQINELFKSLNLKLVMIISEDQLWEKYIQLQEELIKRGNDLKIQICLQIRGGKKNFQIQRWRSEKIAFFVFEPELNEKNQALLSKEILEISNSLISLKGAAILNINLLKSSDQQISFYFTLIQQSFKSFALNLSMGEKESIKVQDILFNPLQPHSINLQLNTYEFFENDDKKYKQYQQALTQAFLKFKINTRIVIYYIGAGRGRLLQNIFRVSTQTSREVFVYAIEKYPYPIQTLKRRISINNWGKSVQVIHSDIRHFKLPEHADIYLSELLGGFGDNQLAPQCVYWAEKQITTQIKNLQRQTIFIPQKIESYIRPISYQNIHRTMKQKERQIYSTVSLGSYYSNFDSMLAWSFVHPIREFNNQREDQGAIEVQKFSKTCQLQFIAPNDIVVNGFAGYFKSLLISTIEFSILPQEGYFSKYSWHPIYFPFQKSELLRKGQKIKINIQRKRTVQKVWYQWKYIKDQFISQIHNRDGKTISIHI